MWQRFKRAIKSLFGGAVASMEDPKLILEQNIRELNDQVPKMNENIATVKANLVMLRKEREKYERLEQDLTNKIKSAINANRDDIAETYALQLEKAQESRASTEEQETYAQRAYDKSLQVKKTFMREKDRKIREAREALQAHERAQWQSKIADTLEKFEVTGLDSTHNEMVNRINEQTAKNEARMEMALDSVDADTLQIEQDAEKLRAADLVAKFKQDMGRAPKKEAAPEQAQEEPIEKEPAPETSKEKDSAKTIGRHRSQ